MDFLTTANLLMDMRDRQPTLRYDFDGEGNLIIRIRVQDNVPDLFNSAARMFEPTD